MEVERVKRYIGKKCRIILKNNNIYTAVIPNFYGNEFDIIDKYGRLASISCEIISLITEVQDVK